MKMKLATFLLPHTLLLLLHCQLSFGFWWWVFQEGKEEQQQQSTDIANKDSIAKVFAPFELSQIESKFLAEASHYLGNLPKLDQCNLLIINRLKSSCSKLTEVDISKLGVNLLNCQSAVEGRKIYKCTDKMELSECTKEMDPDTWNAYHVVSNRARAVCYNVRQTEFRIKTEITINSLANSAKENLVSLQHLLENQKDLGNKTSEAMNQVIDGNDKAIKAQAELNVQQTTLKEAINDNINELSREKGLMEKRQKEIKKHSSEVKKDLEEIAGEIKRHHLTRSSSDKELLSQVQAIQIRAQDVLSKLDEAVSSMDNHYASIEQRHSKIIEDVQDIQQTINFVSNMIINFEDSFHNQMKWINDAVGGTRDKISVISILLGHVAMFSVLFLLMFIFGSSLLSKVTLMVLLPMNAVFALQNKQHFTYKEMFFVVSLTYPAFWCFSRARSCKNVYFVANHLLRRVINHAKEALQTLVTRRLAKKQDFKHEQGDARGCEDLLLSDEEEESQSIVTSTPQKLFNRSIERSINRSQDRPHEISLRNGQTPRRCGSLTRTGQRCKAFCKKGSTSCSRHEYSYNSYFEQSLSNY